jgi:S-adenosylmethionine synthetase
MRNILIDNLKQTPLDEKNFEIVERKGIGHPDTTCDAIMDRVSVNLSKEYLEKSGAVMHHNADKSLLVAGNTELRFEGGRVKAPMLLIFGDRATSEAAAGKNPVRHVGKIYNLLTHHIANQIYSQVEGIREVYVWLLSKIGEPIDQPAIATAHVIMKEGNTFSDATHKIQSVIDYELENIGKFCEALAYGRLQIY